MRFPTEKCTFLQKNAFPAEKCIFLQKNALFGGHVAGNRRNLQEGFRAQESRTLANFHKTGERDIIGPTIIILRHVSDVM